MISPISCSDFSLRAFVLSSISVMAEVSSIKICEAKSLPPLQLVLNVHHLVPFRASSARTRASG